MNPDDPEEVRRRRLARLNASPPSTGGEQPPPVTSPPPSARASPPSSARASPPSSARPASSSGQKRPAQTSPVASPTPTKKTIPVDRALRRVLRCNIVEGTPKATGEIFEVTKAEVKAPWTRELCSSRFAITTSQTARTAAIPRDLREMPGGGANVLMRHGESGADFKTPRTRVRVLRRGAPGAPREGARHAPAPRQDAGAANFYKAR